MQQRHQAYLDEYLKTLPESIANQQNVLGADHFCSDEYNANLCADLVVKGEKTATCSLHYWYSHKGETMPKVGDLFIVTNWHGEPKCIIQTAEVSLCPYDQVSDEFAAAEGEGDKTLAWWRKAHWEFFSKECEELEVSLSQDILLVLERFKVVHPVG